MSLEKGGKLRKSKLWGILEVFIDISLGFHILVKKNIPKIPFGVKNLGFGSFLVPRGTVGTY